MIELLIVIVIIGVFAGIAADFVGTSTSNKLLGEAADHIQGISTRTRSQVLQDRRAYVLEFRDDGLGHVSFWVNALVNGECWSSIETHCVERYDALAASPGFLSAGIRVVQVDGNWVPNGTANCQQNVGIGNNGALCFSGLGYVMYRNTIETNAGCGSASNQVSATRQDWQYLCPPGFFFHLNRMEGGTAVGVQRSVNIPLKDVPMTYPGDAGP